MSERHRSRQRSASPERRRRRHSSSSGRSSSPDKRRVKARSDNPVRQKTKQSKRSSSRSSQSRSPSRSKSRDRTREVQPRKKEDKPSEQKRGREDRDLHGNDRGHERGTDKRNKHAADEGRGRQRSPALKEKRHQEYPEERGGSRALPPPPPPVAQPHGGRKGEGLPGPPQEGRPPPPPPIGEPPDHLNGDGMGAKGPKKAEVQPDFGYSGKLAEETLKVKGVVMKYTEPPEAQAPTLRWRLYVFKNGELFGEPFYIHRQSWYMFGRERKIVDIPTDHPSCSKQHAVIQFRAIDKPDAWGGSQKKVVPYVMDLASINGTFLNGEKLEAQRYYELREKDMLRFGLSSREYVMLHEGSEM